MSPTSHSLLPPFEVPDPTSLLTTPSSKRIETRRPPSSFLVSLGGRRFYWLDDKCGESKLVERF